MYPNNNTRTSPAPPPKPTTQRPSSSPTKPEQQQLTTIKRDINNNVTVKSPTIKFYYNNNNVQLPEQATKQKTPPPQQRLARPTTPRQQKVIRPSTAPGMMLQPPQQKQQHRLRNATVAPSQYPPLRKQQQPRPLSALPRRVPPPRPTTPLSNRPTTPITRRLISTPRYRPSPNLNVVMAPRDLLNLSSSTSLMDSTTTEEATPTTVTIKSLHFGESYSPHKAHWIKNALENLGTAWVRDGKISYEQLVTEEFEEKIGVLYDLAMSRKHQGIDRLVGEVLHEESTKTTLDQPIQQNFPFAPHLSSTVKATMSDALLRIMMRETDAAEATAPPDTKKKKPKTPDDDGHETSSNNSFENSLKKMGSLMVCYVIEGGKLVLGKKLLKVGGSFVHRFGESWVSRARKYPTTHQHAYPFFRRTANMMGFLPHEVKIRYSKESRQIIVSGARPPRGEFENARQVREVIEVPTQVDVRRLIVLRTGKGSLIFEEEDEEEEEEDLEDKKKVVVKQEETRGSPRKRVQIYHKL